MKKVYCFLLIAFLSCKHEDSPTPSAPWEVIYHDKNLTSLQRVLFVNENTGFVTNAYNLETFEYFLLKTNDAGKTWRKQKLQPLLISGFFDFFILNDSVIYANGVNDGPSIDDTIKIFKSTDAGSTWKVIEGDYFQHPGGLYFSDENNGISSTSGGFYKTTDGAKTWTAIPNPDNINFYGVGHPRFTSKNVGYAAGGAFYDGINYGTIVKSSDGGNTWQDISAHVSKNLAAVGSLFFLNDNIGFLFTLNYEGYKTKDGGATWAKMSTNKMPVVASNTCFLNEYEGYIAGGVIAGDGSLSGIYHTKDGGKTWVAEYNLNQGNDGINYIAFPTANAGYATTHGGLILKKTIK